ncbi:MAG TPA: pitrilysin family protein [Candidatus Elarobacter sp.]|nr:pitrilysin family protein [Candidatus Elarobacter sp.]
MKRASVLAALVAGACLAAGGAARAQESQIVPGATSTPPPPGPQRPVQYPAPVATTLPNGLRVLAVRVPGSALTAADLTVRGGAIADPDAAPGVASITAALLTRGTAHRSAKELSNALDALGATLNASAGVDRTDVTTDALAARFPAALAILAEAVREPAFVPDEVTLAKQRAASNVALQNGSPAALANLVALRALFRDRFGRPVSGTARSIAAIDRNAIAAYHAANYRPDTAQLTIGGDLAPADAFALAQAAFGAWKAGGSPAPVPVAAAAATPSVVVVDQPSAGRTAIVLAHTGPLRTAPEWATASVANAVLSGYSGRLNEEIRVKRGLSYGAGSNFQSGRYAGSIVASTLVEHAKAPEALDVMLRTVASLGSTPATADELSVRRTSLLGGIANSVETTSGLVRAIASNAWNGLPLDALTASNAALGAVDAAAVARFGGTALAAPPTIVLVGDASKFLDAVRKAHPAVAVIKAADLDLTSEKLTP